MGNTAGKLTPCFTPTTAAGDISRHHDIAFLLPTNHPLDDGLGHSFCYIRPPSSSDPLTTTTNKDSAATVLLSTTTSTAKIAPFFNTISGASVSANASTSPLTAADFFLDPSPFFPVAAASFESSPSFASVPLQPVPRDLINSGPILHNSGSGSMLGSGPIERGFLSGPIERGFMSGPMDSSSNNNPSNNRFSSVSRRAKTKKKKKGGSGGKRRGTSDSQPRRNRDVVDGNNSIKSNSKWPSIKGIKKTILETILGLSPNNKETGNNNCNYYYNSSKNNESVGKSTIGGTTTTTNTTAYTSRTSSSVGGGGCNLSREASLCCDGEEDESCSTMEGRNLQWAQGKAGEDRVHVVVSEESESSGGWVFVGIYDGFNGPDAPDFLMSNLYQAVHAELKGLLWDDEEEGDSTEVNNKSDEDGIDCCCRDGLTTTEPDTTATSTSPRCSDDQIAEKESSTTIGGRRRVTIMKGEEEDSTLRHSEVMRALSEALRKTEEEYLDIAEKMAEENPELSLMGSCVLVMLMVGEDIYLMNLGDSRAVMGRKAEPDLCFVSALKDLERISSGYNKKEVEYNSVDAATAAFVDDFPPNITSVQLTVDHNTLIKEEVERIKQEHEDDPSAVFNGRVKGSLKVTRAFGAGFLKNPKCNEGLLEMFRIDYIGNSPYITSAPSLHHHKINPRDKFLILSSDGLYQYLSNEEVVSEVETFMSSTPEGDPAQHLIEEVLFRAAKKSGMDFHELLEIPQGERRKYHDDVSIIIISLEGRIWRSSTM